MPFLLRSFFGHATLGATSCQQAKCRSLPGASPDLVLPLVIMTSEDTDAKTKALVEAEGRFGMAEGQIIILTQDKVKASSSLVCSVEMPEALRCPDTTQYRVFSYCTQNLIEKEKSVVHPVKMFIKIIQGMMSRHPRACSGRPVMIGPMN